MKKLNIFISLMCAAGFIKVNAQQWGDFTLYSTMNGTSTYLIDTNGTTVKTWTHTGSSTGYSSYLMPGGTLVRTVKITSNPFTGPMGPICGGVQKRDWNNNVTWDYTYATANYSTHHDICPMPNGNVLLISYEKKTLAEVAAAGCTSFSQACYSEKIVEVQPTGANTGTVVWEWHLWDHMVQNTNSSLANYQSSIVNHPELINVNLMLTSDWIHMNGVDYNPILDQVTFTSHYLNEIFVIDHSTTSAEAANHAGGNSGKGGDILYRFGKPSNYGATGSTIIDVCHDAHWLKEGLPHEGYLAYYNNKGISTSQSCGDFVQTPVNGYNYDITLGQAFLPTTYSVRQATGGYNSNMGNIQELPNGNRLLTQALAGTMKEFSPTGTLLWSKIASGQIPKSFRYDSCYALNPAPPTPTISQTGNDLSASSATTYQWYMNGQKIAGATSQTYSAPLDGIYVVRTTDANGCVFVYSTGYHFTFVVGLSPLSLGEGQEVRLYPNPSTGVFTFDKNYFKGNDFTLTVYDAIGNLIEQKRNANEIDLSTNANGLFNVVLSSNVTGTISKRIIVKH